MANNAELRKNHLVAELHSADRDRVRSVAKINNWYQWAQRLHPLLSTPVQILDIGYPFRTERDQESNTRYIAEIVRELAEVIPQVPGMYEIGGVTYHHHAQDNQPKYTSSTHLKIGSIYCPAELTAEELVFNPTRTNKTTLEIKPDQPAVLRSSDPPIVKICMDHNTLDMALTIPWTPEVLEDEPTPLIPVFATKEWVNLGILNPFNRMVMAKDERNRDSRGEGRHDVDSPFMVENYRRLKKLGVFDVHDNTSQDDWSKTDLSFNLGIGDKFLEFHLPFEEQYEGAYEKNTFFRSVLESFRLMAAYINKHDLDVKWIMGITDERLARAGRIFGFDVKEVPLQEKLRAGWEEWALRGNPRFQPQNQPEGKEPRPFGNILMIYQSRDSFLARFGK